jgi:histidinol-phosphate/aromatic aminotransferase/cobyric acid decarboxylase-like protein
MVNTVERKRLQFEDGYTYLGRNMIMDEHPEHIYKSLLEYFKSEDLHSYPDMWKSYQVLSNFLNVSQDELLITRGVEGAFKQVLETLVDKGDSVGILTPTCRMYHVYAEVYGVDVIEIKGKEPDYKISVEQIKEVVPNIKVLFLDNPKSHLPSHFTHQELDTIITYCNFMGVKVFLDEVYIGWGIDSYLPKLHKHKNLIVSSSFSKIAFASLRVGWLVTNKNLKERIESSRESCELDYFACKSIEFIIDNQDYIKDLKKRILDTKSRWYKYLSKSKVFKVYDSKSYVLRLYSKDKELIRRIYDKLYSEKIVVNIVDDVNLVFSVTNNKKIEEFFLMKSILKDTNGKDAYFINNLEGSLDSLKDTDDGTPLLKDHEESTPKDGWFRRYWSNGNLRYEWEYKDGKRADGVSKGWHENGQLSQQRTYKYGKQDGLWTWWYLNGQKEHEGIFKNGKVDGIWIFWNEKGQKEFEFTYKDGKMIEEKQKGKNLKE